MEDRRKTTAAKSGPIDLLTKLTGGASKRTPAVPPTTAIGTPQQQQQQQQSSQPDGERRPLKTHPLTPPDYLVPSDVLIDDFIELPVSKSEQGRIHSLSFFPPPPRRGWVVTSGAAVFVWLPTN